MDETLTDRILRILYAFKNGDTPIEATARELVEMNIENVDKAIQTAVQTTKDLMIECIHNDL